ncbi:alpha/beta hydrolase fold domain-containing protein [Blastococcus sp. SYSU DS0616]
MTTTESHGAAAAQDAPAFTLPTCFPPTHGVPGPDGRTTYRSETFALVDGYRNLLLDVVVPAAEQPVPVVVFIHGGAFRMGAAEEVWSPSFVPMREKILAAGMAFASITYRFSAEAPFPAQLLDVRAGVRYVRHFAAQLGIDGDRVALWGGSAGAHLALLLAFTHDRSDFGPRVGVEGPDLPVAAVVDFFGVTDVLALQEDDTTGGRADHESADSPVGQLIGGALREHEDRARAVSPITYVRPDAPPVLAFHGTQDGAVGPVQSRRLVAALQQVGASAELVEVDGADHGFVTIDVEPILDRSVGFLRKHLS